MREVGATPSVQWTHFWSLKIGLLAFRMVRPPARIYGAGRRRAQAISADGLGVLEAEDDRAIRSCPRSL